MWSEAVPLSLTHTILSLSLYCSHTHTISFSVPLPPPANKQAPLQPDFPSVSGLEHHADNWADMLKGLQTDAQLGIVPKSA